MESRQSKGIVLYNRNYREQDKLVKIFTETMGKRMFFVKHAGHSKLTPAIQPMVQADYLMKINPTGLSYLDDFSEVQTFKKVQADIFKFSYASYLLSLADAAISDNQPDPQLYAFLIKTLELMEDGLDEEILTNIFEVQLLERFGVQLNFHECVFCHRVGQRFDFSYQYSGLLCPEHYDKDDKRSYLDPNVPYLLDRFQGIQFDELKTISIKPEIKQKIRQFIDALYDNYVGIHLKSKKFIDSLNQWGDIMK